MIKIEILGRIPSKKNSRMTKAIPGTKKVINIPSNKYREWHKHASLQLMGQRVKNGLGAACGIDLIFYFPDNRKCDLTNKAESVMDLLVDNRLLIDDSWQITGTVKLFPASSLSSRTPYLC